MWCVIEIPSVSWLISGQVFADNEKKTDAKRKNGQIVNVGSMHCCLAGTHLSIDNPTKEETLRKIQQNREKYWPHFSFTC